MLRDYRPVAGYDGHGWKVVKVADGYLVPLAQPERGLIPLLLDGQAAEPWVSGERVFPTLTGPQPSPLVITGSPACRQPASTARSPCCPDREPAGQDRPTAPPVRRPS